MRKDLASIGEEHPLGENEHHFPFEPGGESVRERIIVQAVALFCRKGYAATSVREIVEAARVTKPTLYYYFENKEDLFRHILTEGMEEFHSRLRAAYDREDLTVLEKIEAVAGVYFNIESSAYDYVRFLHTIAFSGLYHDVYDFDAAQEQELTWVTDLFQSAQKEKVLRSDLAAETLACGFIGMCEMTMRNKIYGGNTAFATCLTPREILELVLKGMRGTEERE